MQLNRLVAATATLRTQQTLREATLIGRSGLASRLPYADFAVDAVTGVTIAYLVARRNLRRQFTLADRQGTTDRVLEVLLGVLAGRPARSPRGRGDAADAGTGARHRRR